MFRKTISHCTRYLEALPRGHSLMRKTQSFFTLLIKENIEKFEKVIREYEIKVEKIIAKSNLVSEAIIFLISRNAEDLKPFNEKNKFAGDH